MIFRSRAPVRIDFAGGWSDVALFCKEMPGYVGYVVSAAINLYSYVTVKKLPENIVETKEYGYRQRQKIENKSIHIYSADFDLFEKANHIKDLEYNGSIDLIKAAIKESNRSGIEIVTRCDAPAGSGLGSSASMGVALCGALCQDLKMPYEYAEKAAYIEQHELGILGGKQDQYSSAYGGLNLMEFKGEGVRINRLPVSRDTLLELQKNLVLCYTGKSRLSSDVHQNVMERVRKRNFHTRDAISNLPLIAYAMKGQLCKDDLEGFGRLLSDNWDYQKKLHPSISSPEIDNIFDIAMQNGAAGGKACGAGGGGCLIFYCPDTEHNVRKALAEDGMQILNFQFDFDGLQKWSVE